jgi:hypothetical protein
MCGQRIVRIKRGRWISMREMHGHASELLGPTFARCWPVDESFSFDALLEAIDAHESGIDQRRTNRRARSLNR